MNDRYSDEGEPMTTAEIGAALDDAEAVIQRLAEIAPRIIAMQKAVENGECTGPQYERYHALKDFIDAQSKVNP